MLNPDIEISPANPIFKRLKCGSSRQIIPNIENIRRARKSAGNSSIQASEVTGTKSRKNFIRSRQTAGGAGVAGLRRAYQTGSFFFNTAPREFTGAADACEFFSFTNRTAVYVFIFTADAENIPFVNFSEFCFDRPDSFLFVKTRPFHSATGFIESTLDGHNSDPAFEFIDGFFAVCRTFHNR